MTPEAVIFDIGNVLIEWQPERFYDRTIGEDRRRAMFASVDLHAMNDRVDMGGHFTRTIYAMAESNPDWRDEIRMWHDHWIELAQPEISRSVRLLRALRARGVPVFSLTNFGIQSFDYAATHYPFLTEFDRQFISGHLGVIKPDPKIYEIVETDSGIAPSALLFTDDRADNIAMAASRGWRTHLFDGPDGWADRLVAEGLLSETEAA
ncbi:HAD family hydrolase [Sedimentitalea arenosa]|uniref:HAD family phosphatase n=1 Tax=Sedimentitalea arenosa TaxID=2798803 RepID=A0A8J7IMP3_9RHOB|nr:HAD family phosphatase [Arenibacterium arenosum]MBJ6373638.1 HAD family phosphatase [Arenibacterium arenosum]